MDLCIVCNSVVGNDQRAVSCDKCTRWTHTLCGTGISNARYNDMRNGIHISWVCIPCREADNMRVAADYGPSEIPPTFKRIM